MTDIMSEIQELEYDGVDGSALTPADLAGTYRYIVVAIDDLTNIGSATEFDLQIAIDDGATPVNFDSAALPYTIPAAGFQVAFDVGSAKKARLVFDAVTGSALTVKLRGVMQLVE